MMDQLQVFCGIWDKIDTALLGRHDDSMMEHLFYC